MARFAFYDMAAHEPEKDILLLGDFNEQQARPNLSFFRSAGWNSVIDQPTNLGSQEIYDHILLNPRHTREYAGRAGVMRPALDERHFNNNDRAASEAVSDHRPAGAETATGMADDDG